MGRRILVIDDDAAVLATLEQILRRAGHDVATVSSVAAALELAATRTFDLVISDLVMPDVDGVAGIRIFKNKYPHMQVIAMSGGARLDTLDTLVSAHEAGADELLRKPFGLNSLMDAVGSAFLRSSVKQAAKINRLLLG